MPPQNHPIDQRTSIDGSSATMATDRFTLNTQQLSDELRAIAAKELRETPEIREAALAELRTLLHNTPELQYSDDEYYLLIFLRPCHFYAESALKLVSHSCQRTANDRDTRPPVGWVSRIDQQMCDKFVTVERWGF